MNLRFSGFRLFNSQTNCITLLFICQPVSIRIPPKNGYNSVLLLNCNKYLRKTPKNA